MIIYTAASRGMEIIMAKKILKLIMINIIVLLGLLMFLNFSVIVLYQGYQVYKNAFSSNNNYNPVALPNYETIDWAHKHFQELDALKSEYRSYIGWRMLAYQGETININKQGIRITPQSELASQESPLVVFLGGSTMWGYGVDDKNTIPALFSEISDGRFRTFNLSAFGYRAFQGYIFLTMQINEGLKPYIIISYDGVNEGLFGFYSELEATSTERESQIRSLMKDRDSREETHNFLSFRNFFLGPITAFITQLKLKYGFIDKEEKENDFYDLSQERTERVARALLDSWMSTKVLAEENGALFMCVLQPNAGVGNPNLEHLGGTTNSKFLERYRYLYPMILKLIQHPDYKELSNYFIDLSDIFNGNECIYIDYNGHVSPNGNKIVAEVLYEYLQNMIQKRKEK